MKIFLQFFNALDKGELPIPNVLQPQTLSKSTSVRNLSLSPSIRCINRQTTSILSDDNREEGQSPSLSLDSDFLLREKNSTTASSVENDEVQSQTTDCTSNSIANASTHLPLEGSGGTGALLDLSRFKTEKVIGRTVPCFPHSSDSDCECDDSANNNRQTKKTLLSSSEKQQQSLFLSSLPSAQLQSTLNSLNSSSLISSASSPSPKLSSLIIPENNKKEEKSQQISTKLEEENSHKNSLPPTNNFCLSTTFKEENLANISISDKTLTEDINIKVELSTRQNLSLFLASSSSPSPPLLVKDGSLDSHQQLKPSEYELSTIRGLLSLDEYSKTHLFCVLLHRPVGLDEVSVGLLLSERPLVRSTPERNSLNYAIEISKVTCGSIAEKNGYLMQGDRVFFIQHESTENMRVKEARTLLRSRAPSVHLIVGRRQGLLYQQQHNITNCLTNSSTSGSRTALSASSTSSLTALSEYQEDHQSSIFLTDPALERYAPDSILVTLPKSELIMGLSLDGGLSSRFGDRPIFVKRVFAAGEAALEGRISPGDEIRRIQIYTKNIIFFLLIIGYMYVLY
ncbi:unnamed protein product [Meloidogyne enterolobii]|uniref:Uncharacterized protein n=1 Tax=Meloidogyne enterolobii TaxID=390850 RepID=A0ACB1ARY1_MELEN